MVLDLQILLLLSQTEACCRTEVRLAGVSGAAHPQFCSRPQFEVTAEMRTIKVGNLWLQRHSYFVISFHLTELKWTELNWVMRCFESKKRFLTMSNFQQKSANIHRMLTHEIHSGIPLDSWVLFDSGEKSHLHGQSRSQEPEPSLLWGHWLSHSI
jgi:hypothetical protein